MTKFRWEKYLFLILVAFLQLAGEAAGLHDVAVTIPKVVASGGVATLGCRWILDVGETLYSVKWYRNRQEFYRYLPKELPHTRVFTHDGIIVDLNRSSQHQVVLRDLTRNLTGRYQCEVSADAPSFHTELASSYMHVVDLPQSAPVIVAEKMLYAAGDILRANCSAPPADPPAEITWMINGKLVNGIMLHQGSNDLTFNVALLLASKNSTTTHEDDTNSISDLPLNQSTSKPPTVIPMKWKRRTSASMLEINIRPDFFEKGRIKLACVSSVHTIYSAKAELDIDEEKPQIAPVLGTRDIGDGAASATKPIRPHTFIIIILVCIVVER